MSGRRPRRAKGLLFILNVRLYLNRVSATWQFWKPGKSVPYLECKQKGDRSDLRCLEDAVFIASAKEIWIAGMETTRAAGHLGGQDEGHLLPSLASGPTSSLRAPLPGGQCGQRKTCDHVAFLTSVGADWVVSSKQITHVELQKKLEKLPIEYYNSDANIST